MNGSATHRNLLPADNSIISCTRLPSPLFSISHTSPAVYPPLNLSLIPASTHTRSFVFVTDTTFFLFPFRASFDMHWPASG